MTSQGIITHRSGPRFAIESLGRVNVVGSSATGKTTFSARLARALGIPHVEMDALFWGPNWAWPSDELFLGKLETAVSHDAWILDGNYSRTAAIKWRRAQTVIWLDYSFARTATWSVRRAFSRALTKKELWPGTGNRESFRKSFFSKDSIIWWSVKNHGKIRDRYATAQRDPAYRHLHVLRLSSPAESEAFLASLPPAV